MDRETFYTETLNHFLAPIADFRCDSEISEIMINGHDRIYIERDGRLQLTQRRFASFEQLMTVVRNLAEYVGRPIDDAHLSMDGRLPDGSRVHIILPPLSRRGTCVTIRKFRDSAFTLDELVEMGSLTSQARDILSQSVKEHRNVVVAGGTGTGKTSLLNALSREIDSGERIVVIEESSELKLEQEHTIYLEALPDAADGGKPVSLRDLFVNALRMRPDRILMGEVRRGEALEMIQAMLSGHSGSLSTLHASSPSAAATRLETLCLLNDAQLPVYVARTQVAAAVDIFVQLKRVAGKRLVVDIHELTGLDAHQNYTWNVLYQKNANSKNPAVPLTQ